MGCIQSYFKRAASGSTQASPTDIVKHIVEHERSSKNNSESSKTVPVSREPTSTLNDEVEDPDSEMAERGSLHCVEATAVRTLAASTGTVAILGTTAKCNETVDYRRSVHSEQAFLLDSKDETSIITQKEEQESSEKELARFEVDVTTPSDVVEPTNIVTTAIIEVPPEQNAVERESCDLPPPTSEIHPLPENHLPFVIDSIEKQPANVMTASDKENEPLPSSESETRESTETNENNSELGSSSSEVISSILRQDSKDSDMVKCSRTVSIESNRPNRLSLGQHSIESDQNTMEISSADDVKNESTDFTSPESLRESIDESLVVSLGSKKSNVKEISNTSLNTLGDNSEEDGSDLESDAAVGGSTGRKEKSVKRFDTISSNGESSYRMEEPNYPSVSEEPELEEYAAQQNLEGICEEVFDRDVGEIREIAACEVDKICEEALDKMTDILMAKPNAEDVNNVSESSVLSTIDSIVAEKGSDFDSLSFLDEPSDSRSVSMLTDDAKSCRSETIHENLAGVTSPQDDAQKTLFEAQQSPTLVTEGSSVSSQDTIGAVIIPQDSSQSISEDLPKPPNLEDLPPLPENLDQYDITEEELKAVQLPEICTTTTSEPTIDAAASKIQAGVRGYLTRKQIKGLRNEKADGEGETDTFDTESLRLYAKNKRLSLDSKLVDIENIRKLPKLKATLSECVEEEAEATDLDKAATKIQNTFRNYRARKSICLGDRNPAALNGKSVKFENSAKNPPLKFDENARNSVKEKFELEENEPLIEENKTPEARRLANATRTSSGTKAESDDDAIKQAAVKIQATYRGFRARKSIQISASAATTIQAHFRGYKVRKSVKRSSSLNDLAANSNSSSCSNISSLQQQQQQPDLEKHVTKIQAGVRGYLVRKRHSLQNSAATKIQLNYRRYKSRKMSLATPQTYKTDI